MPAVSAEADFSNLSEPVVVPKPPEVQNRVVYTASELHHINSDCSIHRCVRKALFKSKLWSPRPGCNVVGQTLKIWRELIWVQFQGWSLPTFQNSLGKCTVDQKQDWLVCGLHHRTVPWPLHDYWDLAVSWRLSHNGRANTFWLLSSNFPSAKPTWWWYLKQI